MQALRRRHRQGEPINKCPPAAGNHRGLAELLNVPVLELDTSRGEAPAQIALSARPSASAAQMHPGLPGDAIVGAAN
jgi:electron transport complex protein RnfB